MDGAIQGELVQPGVSQLRRLAKKIRNGGGFDDVFPGISSVGFSVEGTGPQVSLRITKKEGVPVSIVPEGTPNAGVIALKRVDELGFYNLGHRELAKKLNLTPNKTTAAIYVLDLKSDPDCFKIFKIGAMHHQRYSKNAITRIKQLLQTQSIEEVWNMYRSSKRA